MNLKDILFSEQEPTDTLNSVNNTQYTQPLLFFVEYAMARLLINWGIKPDYMIGHSIGEYVAACISGVFSLNDAIRLVIRRGELIASLERGSMLSVGVDKAKLQEILKNFPNIDIAAINSDKAIVVAGTDQDIKVFESYLAQQGYKSKLLNTSHAFHSVMMDGAMADFEKRVSSVTVHEPRIPYVSNLTGELVVWNDLKTPSYWSKHLRHPVQFSKGIKWLAEQGDAVFIEMGPGRSLCSFLNDNAAANAGHLSVNTISQRNQQVDDAKYLLEKMGQLWMAGVKINWDNFYEKEERRRVSLPTYSFERREFTTNINAFDLWRHHVSDKTGPTEFRPEDHMHQFHWQIKPITEKGLALTEKKECFLIFSDNEGFAGELAAYLEAHGQKVIMANEGPAFDRTGPATFALNYGNPDDFNALWDGISNMGEIVSQIIYCPAMTTRSGTADYEHIDAHLSLGYLGLSYLAKSIATIKYTSEINITVIDNFLAAITEEEEINPLKAAIHGPSRVMPLETMNIRCKVIDVSFPYKNGERSEDYLPKIISEIFSTSNEPFVAYRFKQRWVRTFNSLAPEDNTASDISIAKGG
ncbi:MAG TPA: acyltransferase domain-containing protein, partial [Niastella sp.]